MTSLLQEYGTTMVSVIISVLLILIIFGTGVASSIGANTPELVKQNIENGKKEVSSIPSYDNIPKTVSVTKRIVLVPAESKTINVHGCSTISFQLDEAGADAELSLRSGEENIEYTIGETIDISEYSTIEATITSSSEDEVPVTYVLTKEK